MTHHPRTVWAAALLAAAVWLSPSVRAQTPVADYQLQNVFTSSVGTLGPLTTVGDTTQSGFAAATVFGAQQQVYNVVVPGMMNGASTTAQVGLQTPANPFANAGNYSILLTASYTVSTSTSAATKVLDFKNRTTDAGLYILGATGQLQFIDGNGVVVPLATGLNPVASGAYFQLTLTRSAATNVVTAYTNGTQQFQFTDTNSLATLNTMLTLFADDGQGLGGTNLQENTLGSVASCGCTMGSSTQARSARSSGRSCPSRQPGRCC